MGVVSNSPKCGLSTIVIIIAIYDIFVLSKTSNKTKILL